MFYVYILFSTKSKRLYTGFTTDLRKRFEDHNKGIGGSYSKKNKPFLLVYYEAYLVKEDATTQEKFYKSGYGREILQEKIKNSLQSLRA